MSNRNDPPGNNAPLLHTMLAETARLHGDLCALECGDRQVSYRALNQSANQLAHYLRARGLVPDALVAILAERSIQSIVSIMAVLKAGGAFVPIPADLPEERIAYILGDTRASLVLTDNAFDRAIPASCEVVRSDCEAISQHSIENPVNLTRAENIAYCIYTSGSTGRPKGVLVQHSGIEALRAAQLEWFGIAANDRIMQVTSFGFDAFVYDLVMAFGFGATLVLAQASPGEALQQEVVASRANLVTMPPSLLRRMDLSSAHTLRYVICAGEPCRPGLRERVPKRCSLVNSYGPTESTVWSSSYRMGERADEDRVIPIGRAIHGREIYILDEALEPAPTGAVGELYIGGVGLARGYLSRPELTAEKFIPNPFGSPGSRMYRTGDRGRYLSDGNIEFLGRDDGQVKIRGFRIELGEIESALLGCPGVREAAVIAREDAVGEQRLAAYVCLHSGAGVTVTELRSWIRRTLPDYMVPATWSFLEALPLTPNGKLDRKALPEPGRTRTHMGTEYAAPQTPTEKLLAQIWAEALGILDPGVDDGFHTLGGNSIQAIDVAFRVSETLGGGQRIPLPLGNTTIRAYSGVIDDTIAANHEGRSPGDDSGASLTFAPSRGQTQIWFMEELDHAWRAYRSHGRLDFAGSLDVACLRRALNELVARHETLRTAFIVCEGELQCVISPEVIPHLTMLDLSTMAEEGRAAALQKCIREELDRRIDVARAPLVNWLLVKLSETQFTLLQSEHHYIHDGQSFRLLLQDLAEIYSARVQGRAVCLAPIERQYREFCAAERRWIRTEDFVRQREDWVGRLTGLPDDPRLFTHRRKHSARRFIGGQVRQPLAADTCLRVHSTAARFGVSRFSLMFGAFGLLCSKLTGRNRMVIGTALSNRRDACYRRTVGMFVNMVPIPVALEPRGTLGDFLQAVATEVDFALSNSSMPLAEIVKRLGFTRDLKGETPFDVAFSFHDSLPLPPSFDSVAVKIHEAVFNGSSKFDLSVVGIVGNNPSDMELVFEYDLDCFDHATIVSMASQYSALLECALAAHDGQLSELLQLSTAERNKLLFHWNDTSVELPAGAAVHQLFGQQAARTPRAIAVEFEDQTLTYGELDRRANQLAHHLCDLGVGPDVLVAVCLERSLEMIVTLLGILKAGGAYVPLDPDHPRQRLAFMLRDSGAMVLVSHSSLASSLPPAHALVLLDSDRDTIFLRPETNPETAIEPANLAYCIYTSGSTGEPKGVLIEHRSLTNQLVWLSAKHSMDVTDAVLQKTPLSFDASVWEIFAPLCAGARLVLARPGGHRDAGYLWSAVIGKQISILQLVPSMLRAQIEEIQGRSAVPVHLRRLFCGGESLPASLCERAHQAFGPIALHNLYGPTETCIQSLAIERPAGTLTQLDTIGRPIFNTQAYILDDGLDPVPIGVVGELYIGGVGLARGYLNRPDLTAEKFIPNPFGEPGTRMYRTGDLGRYLEDATIEFLGRKDEQVKLRGFRIELGEIESVLRGCPEVREAAVIVREELTGDKRLVGYICVRPGSSVTGVDLRAWLRRSLPEYMVPVTWEFLSSLPMTASGKLDRRALPAPAQPPARQVDQSKSSPDSGNPTVDQLLRIIHGLQPAAAMSETSDFLDLGFDSITLMRLVTRCRMKFGVSLTLMEVMDSCNARSLAGLIESRMATVA